MKAQVSFEFVLIFLLIMISLAGFIFVINERVTDIREQQELMLMKNLANSIKSEVMVASSVNDNYLRRFNIPPNIDGKKYTMDITRDELFIQIYADDKVVRTHTTYFPKPVKGSFIDDINLNTTEHCITKTSYDGIRIARTQASLDANSSQYGAGDEFIVYVSLNCVDNIRSTQFVLAFDPDIFQVEDVEPITRNTYTGANPLFEGLLLEFSTNDIDNAGGRISYGYLGTPCATGSGQIAKIKFSVNPGAPLGETAIVFDPDEGDNNLRIQDCLTGKNTREDLPDSRNNAYIEIV